MKRILSLVLLIFFSVQFLFSCSPQKKPPATLPETSKNFIASLKVALSCVNGTVFKGKAVVKFNGSSLIKIYSSNGIYVGHIKVKNSGVYSSEDLVVAAKYIRDNSQILNLFSGWLGKTFKEKSVEVKDFGKLKEIYYYRNGKVEKVIIGDDVCKVSLVPLRVKMLSK